MTTWPQWIARTASSALGALAISACCALDLPDFDPGDTPPPPPTPGEGPRPHAPPPTPNGTNLGLAVAPPGTRGDDPAVFAWRASRPKPTPYRASYRLADLEHAAVNAAHATYARSVGFRPDKKADRFFWSPPPGCEGDMHCVFDALVSRNKPDVDALDALFRARAAKGSLTSLDVADVVVSFVQSIRYEVPKEQPFGILPPASVLAEQRGDCDSKALLLVLLLRGLGIDAVVVSSDSHKHSMAGIALPVQGTTFTHQGRRYAFTETTAEGWPIGQIAPHLLRPSDWRVVPVR